MKRIFAALMLIAFAPFVWADTNPAKAGPHDVAISLGSNTGGTSFGLEYEFRNPEALNAGAYIHSFQKKSTGNNVTNGEFIIGADLPLHYYQQQWDVSLVPGFALIDINSHQDKPGDATTIGPSLAMNIMYQINPKVSVGIENSRYWVWFNSDYAGLIRDDFSVKAQLSF